MCYLPRRRKIDVLSRSVFWSERFMSLCCLIYVLLLCLSICAIDMYYWNVLLKRAIDMCYRYVLLKCAMVFPRPGFCASAKPQLNFLCFMLGVKSHELAFISHQAPAWYDVHCAHTHYRMTISLCFYTRRPRAAGASSLLIGRWPLAAATVQCSRMF